MGWFQCLQVRITLHLGCLDLAACEIGSGWFRRAWTHFIYRIQNIP